MKFQASIESADEFGLAQAIEKFANGYLASRTRRFRTSNGNRVGCLQAKGSRAVEIAGNQSRKMLTPCHRSMELN